ncbi:MAG: DUF488 domain-containing protein [Gammaproteobacteria bacterium]|nr:DUF488 domain-containing protein [Gammaproteobacteria bacterium]
MIYRRRVLLAVLERARDRVDKVRFQKLLFLLTRHQKEPAYHFLPCRFGGYSFQAARDARVLADHHGLLEIGDYDYRLRREGMKEEFLASLSDEDGEGLENVFQTYGNMRNDDLIYKIYEQYPGCAINSELLSRPHYSALQAMVEKEKPRPDTGRPTLYTIGYESLCVEQYVSRLIEKNVSILVDVRRNPLSRKYGFSKSHLIRITGECGIEYQHIPALGIEGSKRRNLKSRNDYDRLFNSYRKSLPHKEVELNRLQDIFGDHPRIALTCFEKDHTWCHRNALAEAVQERHSVRVEHL